MVVREKTAKARVNAALTLLVRQIQDELDSDLYHSAGKLHKIRELLTLWVKANDLHPETVQTYRKPICPACNDERYQIIGRIGDNKIWFKCLWCKNEWTALPENYRAER